MDLDLSPLLAYTAWEREQWHEWLRTHGDDVLTISAGPNGDGRFQTIGDLIRHIFSAEKRYIVYVWTAGHLLHCTASGALTLSVRGS